MIFAEAGNGRYMSVKETHHFRGLGADPRTVTEPRPTRESVTQAVPTMINTIPVRQISPTRDASLVSRPDGTYDTAREPVSVPRTQLPVPLPGTPVQIPTVPRDPTPVPDVQPSPTVPKATRPWVSTGLTPGLPDVMTTPTTPAPPGTTLPVAPNGGVSSLLPENSAGSSRAKWLVAGGIAALAAVGLVIYLRR